MDDPSFLGRGWSFPPTFDKASLSLALNQGVENINQSLRLLLKTEKGSRNYMPDYGSDLRRFLFRRIDMTRSQEIISTLKNLILNSEPRIEVLEIKTVLRSDGSLLEIHIAYLIRQTNSRHNYVFPYSELEGHNLDLGA